ncbi:MAG: hypothetical protein JWR71_3137 [Pseudarthrobacter sp.]|nr:hypothetical protein [Pseudarthrobacter sp.]
MLRNSLLTAGMLSVLLVTSACGTMTADPGSQSPNTAGAGMEANLGGHDKSSDEIGISQRAAAEKAEAAAAAREAREASGAGQAEAAAAEKAAAAAQKEAQASNRAPITSPAVPAPAPAADAAAKAAPQPVPAPPAAAAERIVASASTTAYALREKTPAGGHGRPNGAGGATGTYSDPITVTAGNSRTAARSGLDVKAGTRIYLPDVRRYFIVDDSCGNGYGNGNGPQGSPCRQGDNADAATSTIWIDMWLGGRSMSAEEADNCAAWVTDVQAAVLDPAGNYAVAPGAGVIHDGICDAGYGNTLVRQ